MKNKILLGLLIIILASMPIVKKSMNPPPTPIVEEKHDSIVRILNWADHLQNYYTSCSGFVVTNELMITAYHCVDDKRYTDIYISDKNKKMTGYVKFLVGNPEIDIAILKGDFKEFKKTKVRMPADGFASSEGPWKACGYPFRGKLICVPQQPIGPYQFMTKMTGQIWAGMSGGPVLDMYGFAVCVNHGVNTQFVLCSPIVNLFENLGLATEE